MSEVQVLSESELQQALETLPGWEIRDGWLRRSFTTPGWPHTMALVQTIGYLAEAAWHHPDMKIGYAKVTVLLQTHKVRGITARDVELARKIEQIACWQPEQGGALEGFPKRWVH